jgi:DNA end-binding protein Ku
MRVIPSELFGRTHRASAQEDRMPPHSIGSGTISFGLVSIPVKLYAAAVAGGVSFNLLHARCGSRIKQQQICPVCNVVVERGDLVRGYEFATDQYVRFTEDELKALEGEVSRIIDIAEFVPLARVDPIHFEKTYYLGPDKGGEKAYRLLTEAMSETSRVALATFVMRGKESLVLIRPAGGGLMLHTMYFADEIRDFGEIDRGQSARIQEREVELARRLIDELSSDEFKPERYEDDYRKRVLKVVGEKIEGKEITAAAPREEPAKVIDLMDALRASLEKRGASPEASDQAGAKKPPAKATARDAAKPAVAARRASPKR